MEVDLLRDPNGVVKISICQALSLVLGFVNLLPVETITKKLLADSQSKRSSKQMDGCGVTTKLHRKQYVVGLWKIFARTVATGRTGKILPKIGWQNFAKMAKFRQKLDGKILPKTHYSRRTGTKQTTNSNNW